MGYQKMSSRVCSLFACIIVSVTLPSIAMATTVISIIVINILGGVHDPANGVVSGVLITICISLWFVTILVVLICGMATGYKEVVDGDDGDGDEGMVVPHVGNSWMYTPSSDVDMSFTSDSSGRQDDHIFQPRLISRRWSV